VGLPKSYCRTFKNVCAAWVLGRRNTLSPCRIMSFIEIAEINSEVHMPQWPPDTEDFPAQHSEGRNEKW
jgi:hypothetical protein